MIASHENAALRAVSTEDLSHRRRIRILIVAPSLAINGGQSRQAVRLIEGLQQEATLDVSFLPHNPPLPRFLRWMQQIKYLRTISTTCLYIVLLLSRIWRFDVIHIFSASYFSYLLSAVPALVLARLFGKKTVLNYRSGEAEDHLTRWRTAIPTMRLADVVVVPSDYLVEVLGRFNLPARAIPNMVELDRFAFRRRHPLKPVFLTSRLLEPLYNVPCVLRAFALIQRTYPEARLTVGADGWMRPELEQLARELKLRNTQFIGFVPFEQMPNLYDSADIYLSATNVDGMPSSITESMSAGLNVVSTDGGGAIPHILRNEESGLIVPRNDPEALAAAAIRLLEHPELAAKLAHNAREACRKYTWRAVQSEWLKLYHELARPEVSALQREQRRAARTS